MVSHVLGADPGYLKFAFADLGLSEIQGSRHEKRVLELFKLSGHPEITNDETAWCAAAVGGWLAKAGYPNTRSLMARSYLKYGRACDLSKIVPRGAIAIWPRGTPPSGHVNIVLEDDGTWLTCIGGNQSNGKGGGVTISRERKARVLGCRLPHALQIPIPQPKPEVAPEPEEQPDEVVPPIILPSPAQQDEPAQTEAKKPWFKRIGSWLAGGGIGTFGGMLYDHRVTIAILIFLVLATVAFTLFMGPANVRAWIKRQVT